MRAAPAGGFGRARWPDLADLLDPVTTPRVATPIFVLAYVFALEIGRAVLVFDAHIGATWPSVGVGFAWLLPYVSRPGWWRRPATWAVVLAMYLLTGLVNARTGMRLDLVPLTGACNVATDLVAVALYLRWRTPGTGYLRSGQDLRRLAVACLLGNAAGWLTLPLVTLLVGESDGPTVLFWFIRNAVSLLFGAMAGALLTWRAAAAKRGPGRAVVAVVTAATVEVMVASPDTPGEQLGAYAVIVVILGSAAVFSLPGTYWYLVVVGSTVTALTASRRTPFGGGTPEAATNNVHMVLLLLLIVAMATAADREGRSQLLTQLRRERSAASEEADRASRQADLLTAVIRAMNDGVLVLDEQGTVTIRNQAAARLSGVSVGESLALRSPRLAEAVELALQSGPVDLAEADLADPDQAAADQAPADQAAADQAPADRTGGTLVVQASRVAGGSGRATVVALHDVTEERRQVDELRTFARVAAHDLRQPLTAIEVWTQLLAGDVAEVAPDAAREPLEHIVTAVAQMDAFLTDLMAYAVARDASVRTAPVDLDALAAEVVAARTASLDPVPTVRVAAPHEVLADRAQLRQVLDNLVGNALKYVEAGRLPVVEITSVAEPGWVILRVDDAGIGIPAGQEAAIFEEFYRAPDHVRRFPGTGLGLAICRRIVQRHGGRISAGRSPLGGARVEVRLPTGGG